MRPSTVIAVLALFVALGGGAYAAVKLPANSVGTKQIKKNAVTLTKIAASARKALKGATGAQGPTGQQGPQGPKGDQGPPGPGGQPYAADASGNVDVAAQAQPGDANTIRIGTSQQGQIFIPAVSNDGAGSGDPADVVYVRPTGELSRSVPSSRRFKRDIRRLRFSTRRFMELRPVSFRYKSDPRRLFDGLVAEDVAKLFPNIVEFDGSRPVGLHMEQLPAILLAEVQRQQREIESLQREVARLSRR